MLRAECNWTEKLIIVIKVGLVTIKIILIVTFSKIND